MGTICLFLMAQRTEASTRFRSAEFANLKVTSKKVADVLLHTRGQETVKRLVGLDHVRCSYSVSDKMSKARN